MVTNQLLSQFAMTLPPIDISSQYGRHIWCLCGPLHWIISLYSHVIFIHCTSTSFPMCTTNVSATAVTFARLRSNIMGFSLARIWEGKFWFIYVMETIRPE